MSTAAPTPAVPAVAATVVLVRDGAQGLEVLMVVRHHEIDFARGAAVFPGGKVAPSDQDPRLASPHPSGAQGARRGPGRHQGGSHP